MRNSINPPNRCSRIPSEKKKKNILHFSGTICPERCFSRRIGRLENLIPHLSSGMQSVQSLHIERAPLSRVKNETLLPLVCLIRNIYTACSSINSRIVTRNRAFSRARIFWNSFSGMFKNGTIAKMWSVEIFPREKWNSIRYKKLYLYTVFNSNRYIIITIL